ncbi:MAG TPA: FABP family protein [Beutenbergiaceae bacterium]|nr:FABP family protein [Beutenbergiaceae bacterium]
MALHPALAPVAALIGTWRGDGRGEYPTITPFRYTEELIFTDVDKPFLHYIQRTWSPTGEPMHTETGYLRVTAEQDVEFILAQPTGQTELAEGSLTIRPAGLRIQTRARVLNAASAKRVEETIRSLDLIDEELETTFAMAAVGVPMTHHLRSVLHRS